jgi:hypothetical protein
MCPRFSGRPLATIGLMLSIANEIVAAEVYQRVGGEPITMATVRQTMDELAAHPWGCGCGPCAWVEGANLVEVFWGARTWARQGRRREQLARR